MVFIIVPYNVIIFISYITENKFTQKNMNGIHKLDNRVSCKISIHLSFSKPNVFIQHEKKTTCLINALMSVMLTVRSSEKSETKNILFRVQSEMLP